MQRRITEIRMLIIFNVSPVALRAVSMGWRDRFNLVETTNQPLSLFGAMVLRFDKPCRIRNAKDSGIGIM
jgi:hypothetical protein